MSNIDQQTINLIISKKFDENFWIFELGRAEALIDDSPSADRQFMNSFFDKGEALWNKHKGKLKDYFCNKETQEPKGFAKNLTEHGIIEIIHKIIELLTNSHNIVMAIAIPLCGLALKKGLDNLCQ